MITQWPPPSMITRLTLGLTVVKLACGDMNNKGVPLWSLQAANNLLWRIHSIHTILSNNTEVQHGNKELERWTEYCRDLYKYELNQMPVYCKTNGEVVRQVHRSLEEEVKAALRALKMLPSSCVDGIPAELLEQWGRGSHEDVSDLWQRIWKSKTCQPRG